MGQGGDASSAAINTWPEKGDSMRKAFIHSTEKEPHVIRRQEILAKYPQIEKLFGSDWRPAPFVVALVVIQLYLARESTKWSNLVFFLVAWIYGGAASHALSLMTHELSHDLLFGDNLGISKGKLNQWFGIFCNVGMGVPSSTMFKRYHMEHHIHQGDAEMDQDIPTAWEGRFFTNTPLKAIWLLLQPAFYALRPTFVRPKKMFLMDMVNTLVIICSDSLVVHFFGWKSLLFLVASTLLGMGFHPVAGHFIAEHYVFPGDKVETYSYYGPLNWICWNVGYHNEHHDFPRIPGWRLPQVRAIAPEFYNNLPRHKSWTYVLWKYVTDSDIGPYNRVVRGKHAIKGE